MSKLKSILPKLSARSGLVGKKTSWHHLGPSEVIFSHGPEKYKKCKRKKCLFSLVGQWALFTRCGPLLLSTRGGEIGIKLPSARLDLALVRGHGTRRMCFHLFPHLGWMAARAQTGYAHLSPHRNCGQLERSYPAPPICACPHPTTACPTKQSKSNIGKSHDNPLCAKQALLLCPSKFQNMSKLLTDRM